MTFRRTNIAARLLAAAVFLFALLQGAVADDIRVFAVDKKNYVLLRDLALVYGATLSGPVDRQVALISKWNHIQFTADGREARVNGTSVWLHDPMIALRGHWAIREHDARMIIDPLIRPLRHLKTAGWRTVVIDAGHGGQDTGAVGPRGTTEKTLAFDIARRVRTHLMKAGFQVYLTRDGDRFIELEQRAERAKRWGADIFVSIHLNSAGSEANGSETYSMTAAGCGSTHGGRGEGASSGNRFDAMNSGLAYQIQRAMVAQAQTADRGVKKARFVVLKHAPCPAVLVETGFLSNRREEARFMTENFRADLSAGIARGIYNYAQLVRMARNEMKPGQQPASGAAKTAATATSPQPGAPAPATPASASPVPATLPPAPPPGRVVIQPSSPVAK